MKATSPDNACIDYSYMARDEIVNPFTDPCAAISPDFSSLRRMEIYDSRNKIFGGYRDSKVIE